MLKNRSGFSIIELMIVSAIIAILAGIAIPTFSLMLPNYRLKGAVQDLYSNMQLAKVGAVRANGNYTMAFDTGAESYEIQGKDGSLVKGVSLSSYNGNGVDSDGIAYGEPGGGDSISYTGDNLTFTSRGLALEAGWIYLTNIRERYYRVGTTIAGVVRLQRWDGTGWE